MQAILPWPVSPEFEDALALATQRHLAQPATAPSTPQHLAPSLQHHHSLDVVSSASDSPGSVPRSSSLMMKTRVAVRDKTPHRFQVVPLRDAAKNREKNNVKHSVDSVKQPPAPWTRQLALLRPSGVGLGLNVALQRPSIPDIPERGRERTPRQCDIFGVPLIPRKGILRGLQGLSPKRQLGSPDRKENRVPASRDDITSPTKRGRRRREYTLDPALENSIFAGDPTTAVQDRVTSKPIKEIIVQTTQENTTLPATLSLDFGSLYNMADTTVTEQTLPNTRKMGVDADQGAKAVKTQPPTLSRHFKSPSLGTIHHLLSASTSATEIPDDTPRVRCRKRTNTLSVAHASTKRYGVYTAGKLDFSPVAPEEDVRVDSTYSLGALLSAYSYDSLPSMYSQDSFVSDHGHGTRPLRVMVRSLQGQVAGEHGSHAIVLELMRDIDTAIGEWL